MDAFPFYSYGFPSFFKRFLSIGVLTGVYRNDEFKCDCNTRLFGIQLLNKILPVFDITKVREWFFM